MIGVLLASSTTLSAPPGLDQMAEPPARWHTSVQLGGGALAEDAAVVVRPRLALEAESLALVLGAPLWVRITGGSEEGRGGWVRSWDNPESWAALVEEARLQTAGATLRIGGLSGERLGGGALLDDYEGWLDPTRPRSGVRLDLAAESLGLALAALADSIVRPRVIGGEIGLAPLVLFGADPERRLRVILDGVADLRAPSASGGRDPFGGSSLTGRWAVLRGENVEIELWTAAGALSQAAIGGHGGLEVRVEDEHRSEDVHHGADEKQHQVEHDQELPWLEVQRLQPSGGRVRDALEVEELGEGEGGDHDHQQ